MHPNIETAPTSTTMLQKLHCRSFFVWNALPGMEMTVLHIKLTQATEKIKNQNGTLKDFQKQFRCGGNNRYGKPILVNNHQVLFANATINRAHQAKTKTTPSNLSFLVIFVIFE
jgi:hypothetical protein